MSVVTYQDAVEYQRRNVEENLLHLKEVLRNEFIHGGHLIALGTAGIALSSMFLFNTVIRWEFLLIIYFGTLCIYGYDYYKGFEIDSLNNFDRTNHLKKIYKYRPLMLIFYGLGFFCLLIYFGNSASIFFGGLLLLSGLMYTFKFKKMTKKIIGLKSFYTAFSFSLSVIFTALFCSYPINFLLSIFFVFVFLQILLITSFCDIKDMDTDKKHELQTLPIYFGKEKFLFFLHIINLGSLILILIAFTLKIIPLFSIFLFFSYLYCFYFIQKAKNVKTNLHYLTNTIVDASYFFWPVFLFLGKMALAII
ncbi:MAG: UbiA family prenyltransferase [Euryarchaeota archaeon]|nr:UbiA family prenyltransferase [Euryarchaeota archaeon]